VSVTTSIAAVHEGEVAPSQRIARATVVAAIAAGTAGAGLLGTGLWATGLATSVRLALLAGGAAVLFICLAFATRWVVSPLAAALGRPLQAVTGAAGMLARENSRRNPARTAVTAGALTIGVALVAFVGTLGAALRGTIDDSVRQQIRSDYVVADEAPLSPAVGDALRSAGVAATSIREGQAILFGKAEQINGVDPTSIGRFYRFEWAQGSSNGAVAELARGGAIIEKAFAASHHLGLGSRLRLQTQSGRWLSLTVRGLQTLPTFGALLGPITISTAQFDRGFVQPSDAAVLVFRRGVSTTAQRAIASILAGFPNAGVKTVDAYAENTQATINTVLNMFYLLLALSAIVSLFGIVNTLALSIVERAREIGTLRAIGMTRRQLTRMVRIESEIIALIGAVIGIAVGLGLAALATTALAAWSLSFSVPWTTLLVLTVSTFFVGMAAGVFPARRAARLDPLHALQYD
jgi:putative ABC transport system permease protein